MNYDVFDYSVYDDPNADGDSYEEPGHLTQSLVNHHVAIGYVARLTMILRDSCYYYGDGGIDHPHYLYFRYYPVDSIYDAFCDRIYDWMFSDEATKISNRH